MVRVGTEKEEKKGVRRTRAREERGGGGKYAFYTKLLGNCGAESRRKPNNFPQVCSLCVFFLLYCVCSPVHMCMWRPEVNVPCLPL